MYNLLISLGVGIAIVLGTKLAGFPIWAGIIPGLLAFIGTFILLARRVANRIQKLMDSVQKEFATQATNQKDAQAKVERAVKTLEQGLVYDKWQLMVGPELHAQIGMLKYMVKDLDGAQAHFARCGPRNYMAKAMEGALHYQRKNYTAMEAAFEAAVKTGKKDAVIWAAYAWCLLQIKEKDKALRVLGRAVETNPTEEKLKASLTQLQNDKRLKMKPYEPTWWQFGLEAPPPPPTMGGGGGRRMQFINRR
ncbi:tetratricopeptide repeat protein [Hyalangium gracile]|uniref:tetratricopeptide repeat protein n=1 Tax=Hyalangium gracile TaxID=394092 RepID=UPI001CC91505|nr:tetratricopeptide repeat protein [Hyalangium gracile]